jgi:hypothetical protein
MTTADSPSPFVPGLQPASTSSPAPAPAPAQPQPLSPGRPRGRRAVWWAVLLLAGVVLAFVLATSLLDLAGHEPVRIFIDGEQVYGGPDFGQMSFGELLALSLAAVLALLVTLVIVPVAVAAAVVAMAIAVVLAVVLGLGLPLLIVALVVGLLLSPLILLGWLLFKLLA